MLTDTGYTGAFAVYLGAAVLALVLFNLWFLPRASRGLRVLLTLPIAALLMTPAYIAPDADTLAPALVVTAFRWLIDGREAAEHALRPLALFTGVGLVVGLVAFVVSTLRGRRQAAEPVHRPPAA